MWGETFLSQVAFKGLLFQSTRPVWGETISEWLQSEQDRNFNPLAPCGARHGPALSVGSNMEISIHSPRVGRDDGTDPAAAGA